MPQPIDVNTELARTTAAQRVQEIADRASLAAQQRQTQHAHDEQVKAETVVHEAPENAQEAAVGDRHDDHGQQRRKTAKGAPGSDSAARPDHGAGDLEVIPGDERHRLDVHV